jgi:nucleoside 2-deoxyribosyltransferase
MESITKAFDSIGNEVYCSFDREQYFTDNNFTGKQIVEYSLDKMNYCDAVLAYIKSPEKSEGLLIEMGYAIAKDKPIYLLTGIGVKTTYLHEIAKKHLVFSERSEITQKTIELFA